MASCDFTIWTDDDGGTIRLTTNSPASHYRLPVLVVDAADLSGDFGPADLLGTSGIYAADLVAQWGSEEARTETERAAARRFLDQWPGGPTLTAA